MFELQQVSKDPRTGNDFVMLFDIYPDKAAARAAARKLRGRWQIVESRVVAQGDNHKAVVDPK